MKELGYRLFALMYRLICLFVPRKKNAIFCVVTNDAGPHGNVGMVVDALQKSHPFQVFYYDRAAQLQAGKLKSLAKFFLRYPYQLAVCSLVLMDNCFLPLGFLKFPPSVKVVQLWHGTGSIKKFGQDVNEGRLRELERRANQRITHLLVNGPEQKKQYAGAFGVTKDTIYLTGLPRTDLFFSGASRTRQDALKEKLGLSGKKLLLYLPTFRDGDLSLPPLLEEVESFLSSLDETVVLGVRFHPYVADKMHLSAVCRRVLNFSSYPDAEELLLAADGLITDYSSVFFDYAVLRRPMYFYAYDLESFREKGRGFYYDYESLVPGPVAKTVEELSLLVRQEVYEPEKVESFCRKFYSWQDGRSTERICALLL